MEECSAQEATIEALPQWIWEARKVRVEILGVNDQGTVLFSGVVQELVSLVALGQRSLKGTARFRNGQIDFHLRNGLDKKTHAPQHPKKHLGVYIPFVHTAYKCSMYGRTH